MAAEVELEMQCYVADRRAEGLLSEVPGVVLVAAVAFVEVVEVGVGCKGFAVVVEERKDSETEHKDSRGVASAAAEVPCLVLFVKE